MSSHAEQVPYDIVDGKKALGRVFNYHSSVRTDPAELTNVQELFALEYLANGYNATAACRYRTAASPYSSTTS